MRFLVFACLLFLPFSNLYAENARPDQMGSIELEEDTEKKPQYQTIQNSTIKYFDSLLSIMDGLEAGEIKSPDSLNENSLNYLSAVYLYCLSKAGVCPWYIEALFEIDVIQSRIDKTKNCDNILRFWRNWMQNDMERRHKYMVSITHMKQVTNYNSNIRPRYIRCTNTIEEATDGKMSDAEFFKERYSEKTPYYANVLKLRDSLKTLKTKVPNIFVQVGVESGEGPSDIKELR